MKWVKSDNIRISADSHVAHEQIKEGLKERFPVAWDFLTGEFEIDDKRLSIELRMLYQWMEGNWVEARHEPTIGFEEWRCIFDCLRHAAEEIGYLPKTKRLEEIREQAKELSGKLLQMNLVHGLAPNTITYEDMPLYSGDWMTILQCLYYVNQHVKDDDPDVYMRDLKKRINRGCGQSLAETVAYRVAKHERQYARNCGLSEIEIRRRLEHMEVLPWDAQRLLRKSGRKAIEDEDGYPTVVAMPLSELKLLDPKEEFESRPPKFEGESPTYPKDMEGIAGADYNILTRWQLEKAIKPEAKEE